MSPKAIFGIVGGVFALALALFLNPFNSVPTGSRGVVTQFGAIKGIEGTKAGRWNGVLPVNVYAGAPIPFLNVAK